MKKVLVNVTCIMVLVFPFSCQKKPQTSLNTDLVAFVNPLVGTDSEYKLSNGNTYPAIARPWGMNFWTPQTAKNGDGWTYAYDASKIVGFKQTHQPSPWINDYAAFSLMPVTGSLRYKQEERGSWFSHKAETALPHYYKVYLSDHDATVEFSPTDRSVFFQFTFPKTDSAFIVLDAYTGGSMVKVIPEERKIIGYCRNNRGGVPENFHNYFVVEFDKDFILTNTWRNDTLQNQAHAEGKHVGAIIAFQTSKGEIVSAKVASSFISLEQAELNLRSEIGSKTFQEVVDEGRKVWNDELAKIQIEGGTEVQKSTFYSCFYRMMLFPRKFYEIDKNGQIVHYSPYSGEVLPGYMFTDTGFWDTFRSLFPFFNLMYPELNSQIMKGLANTYKESGWLPEWASPGHRDCMIGSNSASIVADAYIKGVRGFDAELLYEAAVKNSKSVGPKSSVGRLGAEYYNKLGYVPYNVGINENAARTLEYAYADFCLAEFGKALGKAETETRIFQERSQNYRNLFDPETKLMRGKNEDGNFQSPFNPYKWGDAFTEGNSWHYTWSVFQDVQGLVNLMGGPKSFTNMLDSVFNLPPIFDDTYYGFPIHEITEMQIANMGQYAHGNQPIQHMIYLYNYASEPWKAQYHARNVMNKLYTPYPDGYCGDEDNGQTSAWYVFSALGFYPVAPGTTSYILGSPLFNKATLNLPNGKTFVINAHNNTLQTPYISSAKLNGSNFDRNFIEHEEILSGGSLDLIMATEPNTSRGVKKESLPPSLSKAD